MLWQAAGQVLQQQRAGAIEAFCAAFAPGAEFVNTAREVWGTAFPAGTATSPFTIFYKQQAPATPPTAMT